MFSIIFYLIGILFSSHQIYCYLKDRPMWFPNSGPLDEKGHLAISRLMAVVLYSGILLASTLLLVRNS